jgi:tartrate-resistant acid phosphatase type 5
LRSKTVVTLLAAAAVVVGLLLLGRAIDDSHMRATRAGAVLREVGIPTVVPGTVVSSADASVAAGAASRAALSATAAPSQASLEASLPMTFAVIGDYGMGDEHEAAVSRLVASWRPAFIITTGDDYYPEAGGTGTARYYLSTGAYYGKWLKDVTTTGTRLPVGKARINAFFPTLGNHDYQSALPAPGSYLSYFDLPGAGFENSSGNERFYDFVQGPVHFFALDSNQEEPAGNTVGGAQAAWLETQLVRSTSPFNVVYGHHPPYSSDANHGSSDNMRWPFKAWGADVVLSGHAHTYERVIVDGFPYLVDGLGGGPRYAFTTPVDGSVARFSDDWGALKVTVTNDDMTFEFHDTSGRLVDRCTIAASRPTRGQ